MKRTLSVILALAMIFSIFSVLSIPASAAETEVAATGDLSGTTGDCTWRWNARECELTITGEGNMADYEYDGERPWDEAIQGQNFYSVSIGHEVKKIGAYAFANTPVKSVSNISNYGGYANWRADLSDGWKIIGEGAFCDCNQLEYFYSPSQLKRIDRFAFSGCTSLKLVQLSWGLETIGDHAFYACPALHYLEMPTTVTDIGDFALDSYDTDDAIHWQNDFTVKCAPNSAAVQYVQKHSPYNCPDFCDTSLFELDTDSGISSFDPTTATLTISCDESDDPERECVWEDRADNLYIAYWGDIKKIVIDSSVYGIGNRAFSNLIYAETIVIGNNVVSIGDGAFSGSMNLKDLRLYTPGTKSKLKTIGKDAFYECRKLKIVDVPASVTTIGAYAFGFYFVLTDSYTKIDDFGLMTTGDYCNEAKRYCDEYGFTYAGETFAPEITKITNVRNGVQLTWTKSASAPFTTVFRVNGTTITPIGTTDKTSFIDNNVQSGKKYTYCVQCFAEDGITTVSNPSDSASITWYSAPELIGVQNVYNGQKIMWRATTAKKYRVYSLEDGKWKFVGATEYTNFTRTGGLKNNTEYKYTVIGVAADGTWSGSDTRGVSAVYLAAPTCTALRNTLTGINVKWNATRGASKYAVYASLYKPGNWSKFATVTGTSADYKMTNDYYSGVKVYFTVRAIGGNGGFITGYNPNGWAITYVAPVKTLTLTVQTDSVKVSWSKSKNQASFLVYRRESTAAGWEYLGATTGTTWNDNKNLKSGVTYYYTVIARDKDKNRAGYNTNTKIKFVVAPTNIKAANAIGGIQVSWTGSKGANYYLIYRRIYYGSRVSVWKAVGVVKADTFKFLDKNVKKGTTYQYTVRAADRVRNADGTYRYQATSAFRTNSNKITRNR